MKFGGAVLNNPDGFTKMLEIFNNAEDKRILIVISAFAKSTRNLKQAALLAETGNFNLAVEEINKITEEHKMYAKSIISNKDTLRILLADFAASSQKARDLLKGVSITKELTPRTLDAILSIGEQISLSTAYYFLSERGINIAPIDSTNIIVSDTNHGNATPILEKTRENIESILVPALKSYGAVITQGFVSRSTENEITTMGMESSNLTAAIYTSLLDADELVVFTDTAGIRTEDPKSNPETSLIKYLSYKQAYSCSVLGLKLIFPQMIDILEKYNKKLIIKSAFGEKGYSEISNDFHNSDDIILIERENVSILKLNINSLTQKDELLKTTSKIPNRCIIDLAVNDNYLFIAYCDKNVKKYFQDFKSESVVCKVKALLNFKADYNDTYKIRIKSLLFNNDKIIHSEINQEITKIYYL